MAQSWHDLLFMHWPVPVEQLRPLIPDALEIDTFKGQAWIAVVPFWMSGIRFRFTFPVPGTHTFPELNVRTYVKPKKKENPERPGVWFFSLDAASRLAVRVARAWFNLPYYDAAMQSVLASKQVRYESTRFHRNAPKTEFKGAYEPTGEVFYSKPGTLEHWLTERYCLYSASPSGTLYRGEIHHHPWPLQPAQAQIDKNSMLEPLKVQSAVSAPHLLFSKRIDVVCWAPLRLD